MSMWVKCEKCGALKEVPAYEGDGTYHDHYCEESVTSRRPSTTADDEDEA